MNIKQLILESYDLLDAHVEAAEAGVPLPDRTDLTKIDGHWGYHTGPVSYVVHNVGNQAIYHYKNNRLHRDDGPAVETAYGEKYWYKHGQRHRDDGPAIEYANGNKHWYKHGQRHRDDGPAVEFEDGGEEWHTHGTRHLRPDA